MTSLPATLKQRAEARYARIAKQREDPRYRRVLGRFVQSGLLTTNDRTTGHGEPIRVTEALWAGELEPRILELLPALLVKKPSFFVDSTALPDDLARVVRALKRGGVPDTFRGIPGPDLARWLPRVGRKGKLPSRLRCFRFSAEDSEHLARLARELGLKETAVLRRALRELALLTLPSPDADPPGVSEPPHRAVRGRARSSK